MIVRQIILGVVVLDTEALENFDWFNDYKDTRLWLQETHPQLVEEFNEIHDEVAMKLPKPCPFCGSRNITLHYDGQPAIEFGIVCNNCGGAGPMVQVGGTASGAHPTFDNPEAFQGWNRRAKQ